MKFMPNIFVYQEIQDTNVAMPDLPVKMSETYSQCYEDILIVSKIRADILNGEELDLAFIELGANHPFATSNTYLLEKYFNINGILVDANPTLIPALQEYRTKNKIINAAVVDTNQDTIDFYISVNNEISSVLKSHLDNWKNPDIDNVIKVPTIRINSILNMLLNKDIILIIDVEGMDMNILRDMDFKVNPYIIQAEAPEQALRNEMITFMRTKGYKLFATTDVNLLFTR